MKANQLRIGNYITTKNHVARVTGVIIYPDGIEKVQVNGEWINSNELGYVELNESILSRLGLERIENDTNSVRYRLADNRFEFYLVKIDNDVNLLFEGNSVKWIKYLHELQNISKDMTDQDIFMEGIA